MKRFLFNKALRILLITNGLILVAAAMLGPIYALFVEDIGGDLLAASLTGGIFALAAGVTSLFAGKFADKVKRSELIIAFSYALTGVGFILYLFVNSILFLFGVQILIGFSQAVYNPAFDALYSKHLDKGQAGREWGAWEALNYFSTTVGAIIGGLIVTYFGFNALFIAMSILCFISSIYIFYLPKKIL